ncbi:calcium/sodium antiporter [Candidatus Saccharibacteria bacterium]|nr:calcium/sodium antiporter [Candidatus Saccharibacteria bacterium]
MEIALQVILLIVGFVILIKGADWLIDGASSAASHFKVSKLLIGLTIIAFGTGAPELAVSVSSLINGTTDMLLGNVIGSNILNILLLIGLAALIRPIRIKKDTVAKELPLLLLISTILVVLFLDVFLMNADANTISRADGIICLLCFTIFLFYIISMARKNRKAKKEVEKPKFKLSTSLILVLVGLVGVVGGSELVVSSASTIATAIGISDRMIALTVIAFGTSLPELITTIKAAKKGETELLVGNIIGSNIFNICIVLGLPVTLFGTVTPDSFELLDIVMLVGSTAILLLVARSGRKITRGEGALMLTTFAIYYSYIVYSALSSLPQ